MKKTAEFSLKDQLFSRNRIQYLADLFLAADRRFDAAGFVRATMKNLRKLELKERIVHIAATLEQYLSADYTVAVRQIMAALPPPLDESKHDNDFGDFIIAPLGEFVVRNGMARQHLKQSLNTLRELTKRFSMEDAIRAFINTYTDETMRVLSEWSTDENYHVRRLVSEGTRPRLPWSKRLSIDVSLPLPLLETLHCDNTRYVTRSVANHLNDLSRSQPQLVIDTLKRWKNTGQQNAAELRWISRHALRTLVKQGDADAMQLLGFKSTPKINVTDFVLQSSTVTAGEAIEFSFTVTALRTEPLLIDYVIDFVKANGRLSPRVHKLKEIRLQKEESQTVRKRHVLKANATTYTLYPGTHQLTLQINGKACGTLPFALTLPSPGDS